MNPKPNKRERTIDAIMDAAERLVGERGIHSVSLREISGAAGSSNHFAVQYYFGDFDKLLNAVFSRGLPVLESRRAQMLLELQKAQRLDDATDLLGVILIPLIEQKTPDGRSSYARFVMALTWDNSLTRVRANAIDAPVTRFVVELLRGCVPHLSAPVFAARMELAVGLFLKCYLQWERKDVPAGELLSFDEVVSEALIISLAILRAPVSDAVNEKFGKNHT